MATPQCDVCAEPVRLLEAHDAGRSENGCHLSKEETMGLVRYMNMWPNSAKQCLCCYTRDLKNLDRMNSLVQNVLLTSLHLIRNLPDLIKKERNVPLKVTMSDNATSGSFSETVPMPVSVGAAEVEMTEKKESEKQPEILASKPTVLNDVDFEFELTDDEKLLLLEFTAKVFLLNFPLYFAQKTLHPISMDDTSFIESQALHNYCEIACLRDRRGFVTDIPDPETNVVLLRNVCFWVDINGAGALKACFEKASPSTLPVSFAHILVNIVTNLRMWLNKPTNQQHIVPVRAALISYMCTLSDADLRQAANRNMLELVWTAIKDPAMEACLEFDEGTLALAFKYFTSTTLTIRLQGIAQINNHIAMFNESMRREEEEAHKFGESLADWLIANKIVEHIFGPNLHNEIVKVSLNILQFLASDSRLTSEHLDCLWVASQLKHCSKQVYEILIQLIKNLDIEANRHLCQLLCCMDPSEHNESTLMISSHLDKFKWQSSMSAHMQQHQALQQHQLQPHLGPCAALRNDGSEPRVHGKAVKHEHDISSSESCDDDEEEEDGGKRPLRPKSPIKKPCLSLGVKGVDGMGAVEMQVAREEQCCSMHHHHHRHHPHQLSHHPRHHHHHDLHDDSMGSDSSLGAQSDLSEDSIQEDQLAEVEQAKNHKFLGKQVPVHQRLQGRSQHVDSEECTESSQDEEEEDEEEDDEEEDALLEEVKMRKKKGHLAVLSQRHLKLAAARANKRDSGEKKDEEEVSEDSKKLNDSSEIDIYGHDHSEVELVDSEDEEVLKEARLVRMKQAYPPDTDDSSDSYLEEEEMIIKHHLSRQSKLRRPSPNLLLQATNIVLRHKKQSGQSARAGPACANPQSQDGVYLAGLFPSPSSHEPAVLQQDIASGLEGRVTPRLTGENLPGCSKNDMETEVIYDCTGVLQPQMQHPHRHVIDGDYIEDIMSPDDGSCHSSRISTKSEKNMADFEGEEALSEEELAQINAHAQYSSSHMATHLSSITSLYHSQLPKTVIHHHAAGTALSSNLNSSANKTSTADFTFDNVCQKGNTLIWDLVQDDMASRLPEGLLAEAERALHNLVGGVLDRCIKNKFIEACIRNLAEHKSVIVSLRLLPHIFDKFHHSANAYRSNAETHQITMWAEQEHHMMAHFFDDLMHFTDTRDPENMPPKSLYSYREEIQARLLFLQCVFSIAGSPDRFRLNQEQVDTLWRCLAENPVCSDDCLMWFLNQAKSKDHHALGVDSFRHIFLYKIPQLSPEKMTMTGLSLFQHLSQLTRMSSSSHHSTLTEDQICGLDQLWEIALRAESREVSMHATQVLNNYHINFGGGTLDKEDSFIGRCMQYLVNTINKIKEDPMLYLRHCQRGLGLLKNHLELFNKRYAFHLRIWQLDGVGVTAHRFMPHEEDDDEEFSSQTKVNPTPIHITLQTSGINEKTQLEMLTTDLVSELRAEVTRWWEMLQKQQQQQRQQQQQHQNGEQPNSHHGRGLLSPILGAMLGDGPIRIITLGQELTVDADEKTLVEVGIKEGQPIYVSVGASRQPKRHDGSLPSASLPVPDRAKIPQHLLTQEPNFGHLFTLLEQLSSMKSEVADMLLDHKERVQVKKAMAELSRKVWELLLMLPTSPAPLEAFITLRDGDLGSGDASCGSIDWNRLLPPHSTHRLCYSLQIVEQLATGRQQHGKALVRTGGGDSLAFASKEETVKSSGSESHDWNTKFVLKGGMNHLWSIFMNGTLMPQEGESWSQWKQECLTYLLRIIIQFSVERTDAPHSAMFENEMDVDSKKKGQPSRPSQSIDLVILSISQETLKTLNVEAVMKMLMTIIYEAAVPTDTSQLCRGSMRRTRTEVVRCAMSLLISLAYSSNEVNGLQNYTSDLTAWLKRLTVSAPEPNVRDAACTGLYRLCLGRTDATGKKDGGQFLVDILANLLTFLADASIFVKKPPQGSEKEGKEVFGPCCRDYFWLLCQLIQGFAKDDCLLRQHPEIDLETLARQGCEMIRSRRYYETRHGNEEDEGLCGLLHMLRAIVAYNLRFKESDDGKAMLRYMYEWVFDLPSHSKRYLPLCKSPASRQACFDLGIELAKGSQENYAQMVPLLMAQHNRYSHIPYNHDYWPIDDGRSKAGYVGIQNLGATCYMASALQFLFFIPDLRQSILQAKLSDCVRHQEVLRELQKMFAFLQESERKSYNPKSFCKNYIMDNQPLNTGEQKDMTEFFTDLITKIEEMSPELKVKIKDLFGGVTTNNIISLDCPHVSRTFEEFYTIRCQVSDMKDLYASLNEITVKDTLEGDNRYNCSDGCKKPVRAEKRACFRKLPSVLCVNTMRYAFNINTMQKEKVNTHFSFPRRLDMSPYMEHNLLAADKLKEVEACNQLVLGENPDSENDSFEYELMGVTVHTGTAEGGHYYSFIRDDMEKEDQDTQESWLLFNDAEVKPFDDRQLAIECFGGEMTSKTYDSTTEKFLDFSFEKTNSAYMLFYKRIEKNPQPRKYNFTLPLDLAEWIWQDNKEYLKDRNLFEHSYFNFMWQVCGILPATIPKPPTPSNDNVLLLAAQLTSCFVLETFIHSKEKPTMLQWIETLTKQFIASHDACRWIMNLMAEDDWWPTQILIKCPTNTVRQLFYRLVLHVITQLKSGNTKLYPHPVEDANVDIEELTQVSCVTRCIKKLLSIIEHGVRPHSKYLTEYFSFLLELSKMGEEECAFLTNVGCITTMVNFYMGQKQQENYVEILSDDEEEEEVLQLPEENKPTALEKMIALIALLVEKSRGSDKMLHLSECDMAAIMGSKGFPFLINQIRDQLNLRSTCNLIYSLTRNNDSLAVTIVNTIFAAIKKHGPETTKTGQPNPLFQHATPFFKILALLVENNTGSMAQLAGMPMFIQIILHRMWDLAKVAPIAVLDWLTQQVTRNKMAHIFVLEEMDLWVESFLIAHDIARVRNAAAYLLISLVPCAQFRQMFRSGRTLSQHKDIPVTGEALNIVHRIYLHLLCLLSNCKNYVDPQVHGTMKLVCYFTIMQFCILSKREKQMFSPYFMDLWQLFQPKLLEPQIAMHHNKQALLIFWYIVSMDCQENIELITSNSHVCKNIAFNYILADHDDQDIMMFNRCMLPSYYGLLRMCCQHSRQFTRQLAMHQNIQWAFKNITPYPSQYHAAVDELYKMMRLMATRYSDSSEEEIRAVNTFRRNTIVMYIRDLEGRTHWQTIIAALKILVESQEERLLLLYNNGLSVLSESFNTLHVMYHEATACHVTGDIIDLLTLLQQCLKVARETRERDRRAQCSNEMKQILSQWKERQEMARKLLTLLNSYSPPELRSLCIEMLKQMILTLQPDMMSVLVPILYQWHSSFSDTISSSKFGHHKEAFGPYFPRRGQKPVGVKTSIRPPRPQFQMMLGQGLLECAKGIDEAYDQQIYAYFIPYHMLLDTLQRLAINMHTFNNTLINLGAMVAYEGVQLHCPLFAKLWNEIHSNENADPDHVMVQTLCKSQHFLHYCEAVLMDERASLNNINIFTFFQNFFPKVYSQVLRGQVSSYIDSLVASTMSEKAALETVRSDKELMMIFNRIGGDVRAMMIVLTAMDHLPAANPILLQSLHQILTYCQHSQQRRAVTLATRAASGRVADKSFPVSSEISKDSAEGKPDESQTEEDTTRSLPVARNSGGKEAGAASEEPVELMCVDVTETSESVEVCTTPNTSEGQTHNMSGSKRQRSENSNDQPATKKARDESSQDGSIVEDMALHESSPVVLEQPEMSGGRSSPDSTSSGPSTSQASSKTVKNLNFDPNPCCSSSPTPSASQKRLQRRGSRESEDGGSSASIASTSPASSSSSASPLSSTSSSSNKTIVDKVAADIEQLLSMLETSTGAVAS